jgi:TetR/AcrR family transcriptional regulator, cholesterol catabolism regulator
VLPDFPTPAQAVTDSIATDDDLRGVSRGPHSQQRLSPAPAQTVPQQARRESLVEAGLTLLGTDGYEQIQVRDVVEKAGLSLATMYHYFSSKEHLFSEVLFRWASSLGQAFQRRPLVENHSAARLQEAMFRAIGAFERQPQMARLINVLTLSSDPYAAALIGRLHRSHASIYLDVLAPMDPATAQPILDVTNSVFTLALREWSMGRMPMTEVYDRVAEAIRLLLGD